MQPFADADVFNLNISLQNNFCAMVHFLNLIYALTRASRTIYRRILIHIHSNLAWIWVSILSGCLPNLKLSKISQSFPDVSDVTPQNFFPR